MRTPFVLLLLFGTVATAAPVPKAVKQKPTSDGAWRLVLVSVDGQKLPDPNGTWVFDGVRLSIDGSKAYDVTTPDPARPHLRRFGPHPAVLVVGADRLLFCYAPHLNELTECKPGQGIHYYEFERVKEE